MASQKNTDLAQKYLAERVPQLAEWLEAHTEAIRREHGDEVLIFIQRGGNLQTDELEWHYGNITFELSFANEVL